MPNRPQPKRASTKKDAAGFTLVEGLVTAVIVAILAAAAIPMYLGYLNSQRQSAVESLAQSASVSANAIFRRGVTPTENMVKSTLFLPNPAAYTVTINTETYTVTVQDAIHNSYSATMNYR
jgi:type IV pilus assembly protein PilE